MPQKGRALCKLGTAELGPEPESLDSCADVLSVL